MLVSLADVAVSSSPVQMIGEKYADVFEAARILELPVIVVLWLAEAGAIPAQPLREHGVRCWMFRRRDLERARADIEAAEQLLVDRGDGVQVVQ